MDFTSPVLLTLAEIECYGVVYPMFKKQGFYGWELRCPECLEWFPVEQWEGEVDCEECGYHLAIRCENCWCSWDLVYLHGANKQQFILRWGEDCG